MIKKHEKMNDDDYDEWKITEAKNQKNKDYQSFLRTHPWLDQSKKTNIQSDRKEKGRPHHNKKNSSAMKVKQAPRIKVTSGAFVIHDRNGNIKKAYHLRLPTKERHQILDALARQKKGQGNIIGLYRGLLARRTLGKNRLSKKQYNTFTQDMNYLQKKYRKSPDWSVKKPKYAEAYEMKDNDDDNSDTDTGTSTGTEDDDETSSTTSSSSYTSTSTESSEFD